MKIVKILELCQRILKKSEHKKKWNDKRRNVFFNNEEKNEMQDWILLWIFYSERVIYICISVFYGLNHVEMFEDGLFCASFHFYKVPASLPLMKSRFSPKHDMKASTWNSDFTMCAKMSVLQGRHLGRNLISFIFHTLFFVASFLLPLIFRDTLNNNNKNNNNFLKTVKLLFITFYVPIKKMYYGKSNLFFVLLFFQKKFICCDYVIRKL